VFGNDIRPEVQAFMYFGYAHRFVMGVNYHGGAQVVNYPWDAVTSGSPPPPNPTPAPDDALFHDFSVGYAIRNPIIYNNPEFPPEGVTRGWEGTIWGMQDWAYVWRGEHHVTIELTSIKAPNYNTMDTQWDYNRAAMIWWMSRALTGVRGLVTDAETGAPLDAVVQVQGMEAPNSVRTDPLGGDYHRTIITGTYTLLASAACYQDATATVIVTANMSATVQNFQLEPAIWTGGTVTELQRSPADRHGGNLRHRAGDPTDPLTAAMPSPACAALLTLRRQPRLQTERREIVLDQDQVQDFSLRPTLHAAGG
jgi:carboxypeptidase D